MAKSTLHAALKLRLSLLGSMLSSIKESEAHCGEWAIILLQLLVSGAVDRQSDNKWVALVHGDCARTYFSYQGD